MPAGPSKTLHDGPCALNATVHQHVQQPQPDFVLVDPFPNQMTAERRGRVTVAEEAAEAALLSSRMEDLLEAVSRRSVRGAHAEGAPDNGL